MKETNFGYDLPPGCTQKMLDDYYDPDEACEKCGEDGLLDDDGLCEDCADAYASYVDMKIDEDKEKRLGVR